MIALELFHDEGERLGPCFGCNMGDLFVSLFVLLLAHYTKILERIRVIETNLLLSSPGLSLLPALGSSVCCVRGKRCVCGVYAFCHLLRLDLITPSASMLVLQQFVRSIVGSSIFILLWAKYAVSVTE